MWSMQRSIRCGMQIALDFANDANKLPFVGLRGRGSERQSGEKHGCNVIANSCCRASRISPQNLEMVPVQINEMIDGRTRPKKP